MSCCLVVLVSSRQVYGSASVSPSLTSSLPASTIKSSSAPADLGLSESRSSSSYDREAENSYGKRGNAYESSEDSSDEYNQKGSGKKTVILAIPVKLALQQQKQQESYQSSQQSSYGDRDNGRGNSYGDRDRGNSYGESSQSLIWDYCILFVLKELDKNPHRGCLFFTASFIFELHYS